MARVPKTSLTHPLPIAVVPTPGGGAIGLTMCPGKQQPEAITGPWDRDLAADLAVIAAFGARALVTLMESDELQSAAVPPAELGRAAAARGWAWHHWPIGDFKAPDAAFEARWQAEASSLCALLRRGERIVVHCRGGRGRSGLVAARLLVELGLSNAAAIAQVRAAEALAMETAEQEEHVRDYRPVLGLRES